MLLTVPVTQQDLAGITSQRAPGAGRLLDSLAFCAGASVPLIMALMAISNLEGQIATLVRLVVLALPFVAALVAGPTVPHRSSSWWAACAFLFILTFAAIIGAIADPTLRWRTMIGGSLSAFAVLLGAPKMFGSAPARRANLYMIGIQIGFLVFVAALFSTGAYSAMTSIRGDFIEVKTIHRNGVTLLGLLAMCAALARLSGRKVILEALTIGVAGFLAFSLTSKGAWLSIFLLLIGFVAVLLYRRMWAYLIVGVAVLVITAPATIERIQNYLLSYMGSRESIGFSGRTDLWNFAFHRIDENSAQFLGFGFNAIAGAAPKSSYVFHLHNEFINTYYAGGILGLVALLWLLAIYYAQSTRAVINRVARSNHDKAEVAAALFPAFIGILVFSRLMSDVSISSSMDSLPVFLVCCALAGTFANSPVAKKVVG